MNYTLIGRTLLDDIAKMFQARVDVVQDGFKNCAPDRCKDEKSQAWEDYSTPNRDFEIKNLVGVFKQLSDTNNHLQDDLAATLDSVVFNDQGHTLTLRQAMQIWTDSGFSFDPNVPVLKRWGITEDAATPK